MDLTALSLGTGVVLGGSALAWWGFGSLFSPVGLFALVWGAILVLLGLWPLVGEAYVGVSPAAWGLLALSLLAVLAGALAVVLAPGAGVPRRPGRLPAVPGRLIWGLLGLGALGVLAKWAILLHRFGSFPALLSGLGALRLLHLEGAFTFPLWAEVPPFLLLPALLLAGLRWASHGRGLLSVLTLLLLLILNDFALAARGTTVHGFLLLANAWIFAGGRLRRRTLARPLAGGVLLFIGLLLVLNLARVVRERPEAVQGVWSFAADALAGFVFYLTGPVPALSEGLRAGEGRGLAAYTLSGLWRLLSVPFDLLGVPSPWPPLPDRPYVFIPQPFNTYPAVWAFYQDFGWPGGLLVPWLAGLLAAERYRAFRARPRLTTGVLVTILAAYLEVMPRDTMTLWVSFWVELGVAWAAAAWVERDAAGRP